MLNQKSSEASLSIENILAVDRALSTVSGDDLHGMGQALQGVAQRFMVVDSCYLCTWEVQKRMLRFPYNFDIDLHQGIDSPCVMQIGPDPLGAGPTSRVIRSKSSYILDPKDRTIQGGGVEWGRPSESAMHVPISVPQTNGETEILGVFSVQAYTPNAYTTDSICLVEWLGRKAGEVISDFRQAEENKRQDNEIIRLQNELSSQEITLVNAFVSLFSELNDATSKLTENRLFSDIERRHLLNDLIFTVHKIQAKSTHLHLPDAVQRDGEMRLIESLLQTLTSREKEVLPLLVQGKARHEISRILFIEPRTVKFHQANILRKLGLSSPLELVGWLSGNRTHRK